MSKCLELWNGICLTLIQYLVYFTNNLKGDILLKVNILKYPEDSNNFSFYEGAAIVP